MQAVSNKTTFIYDFVKPGTKVTVDEATNQFHFDIRGKRTSYDRSTTLILDVGNCLTRGVVDVHHIANGFQWNNERIVSTAKLLTSFPSLMENIQQDVGEVRIIVHSNPDFDCFASTYLAKYYIEHKEFPENYQEIVEYAEQIDAGRLKLNPNQVFTPYTMTHVLYFSVGSNKFNSFHDYQTAYLERGLELIDYIVKRLPELMDKERSIHNPVLFKDNHPFRQEEALIEEDYQKYQEDLRTICEKRTMRLPAMDGSAREVDGLFWNHIPTCSLDRLWARGDTNSPSGTGYVFTFVPKMIHQTPDEIIDKFKSEKIQAAIQTTNQVIISVDGNSNLTLADLGKRLELEERKQEDAIFGDTLKEEWRTRDPKKRRFQEEWFDSNDPWYDGRNNQYQIVDAPQIGSLLSFEQIKAIVINYTKPRVKGNHTRILYPFHFPTKDFKKLRKSLEKNNNFDTVNLMLDKDLVHYFRPYVREYLFNSKRDKQGYSHSFSYKNSKKLRLQLSVENGEVTSGTKFEGIVNEKSDDIFLEIGNTTIHLFRYGIGFIVIETDILSQKYKDDLLLDLLLEMNKELCEGKSAEVIQDFNQQLLGEKAIKWIEEFEEGLMYSDVTVSTASYFEPAKKELLYRLCSHTEWNSTIHTENKHMSSTLDRMYYDINEHTVMGFSKKGSVLLIFEKDIEHMSEEQVRDYRKKMEEERTKYHKWDYYIFLMVLHQRYGLMNFSKELSEIGVKNKIRRVSKLREVLFEFIIQGWFSQITNNESGMDIHKKWIHVFETQTLHDEVLEQVSTIADYQSAKKDSDFSLKFTILSFVFLIITGVTGFFGMNIPYVDKFDKNSEAIWFSVWSLMGVLGFWGIISGSYWLFKKLRGLK
ncbi:hypothetical protein ACWM35_10375 [Neobacillus sp. K501]